MKYGWIAFILITAMLLGLTACGGASDGNFPAGATAGQTGEGGSNAAGESSGTTGAVDPQKEEEETGVYKKITAEEAYELMKTEGVVTVDVRTESEYKAGHIPGAILVVNEQIGDAAPAELPDKDATLLVYCRSGRRSADAAKKLIKLGYKKVYDFGGIIDWPYEVTDPEK